MSKRTFPQRLAVVPLALLLSAGTAAAQGATASVSGRVTDSTAQAPLVGAEVFVLTGAGTTTRGGRTGSDGRYSISGVPTGPITLRVRLVGYAPKARQLNLGAGDVATVDFAIM